MKRYIVTEEELDKLEARATNAAAAAEYGHGSGAAKAESMLNSSRKKCRSRPVPEWATHFAGGWTSQVDPMDVGLSPYWEVEQCEEMPK